MISQRPRRAEIHIRSSITTGLLKKVLLIYIIFALIITALHLFFEYKRLKADLVTELNTSYMSFRKPLAIAVWNADHQQISSILEGLNSTTLIYGASVIEGQDIILQQVGNVLGSVSGVADAGVPGLQIVDNSDQSDLFGYQYPLSYSETGAPRTIAHVTLFTSKSIIFSRIKYQLFYILIIELVKASLLWLVFFWYGKKQLTMPLSKLAAKASDITMNNLHPIHINVPGQKQNEVTVLQDAFNTMVSNLIDGIEKQNLLYKELDSLKNNLQLQVDARTNELQETNKDLISQIKERKEAEGRASQYDLIFENSLNEIYVCHAVSYEFITVNKEARRNLGYTYEELQGFIVLEILPNFTLKSFEERIAPLYSGEEEMLIFEATHQRKDSSCYEVEVHLQLMAFSGSPVLVAIILDISEKKQLEEQLRKSQKMEVVGTLAGGVAHDLNNILSGIVGYPELLLTSIPEDSHLRKPLLAIQNSGQKAADIVQDLLTMARRGVSVTEVIDLNQLISTQLESPEMEKLISYHPDIDVQVHLDKSLLHVKGSPIHLSKTVMNLFSNATEATSENGLITISTSNVYLDKPVSGYEKMAEGDYVKVSVSDNGIGIAPQDIEKIFEPFYTKKSMARSGTGLGMAVVWGTVKDHSGYIDINSTEGVGTTITIYLPVTREELSKDVSAVSLDQYRGNGESILVVDDVVEQREVAHAMLTQLGYSVDTVASGELALEYLQDNSPDLLVLDMIMEPGLDGLDTYKRVLDIHPRQKAVIASGYSRTSRVQELQRIGAGQYVKKPYTLMSIGFAVKKELESDPSSTDQLLV